jgi:hypothetical protein
MVFVQMLQKGAPAESCITAPDITAPVLHYLQQVPKNSKQSHLLQWISMPKQHYHC